MTRVTVPGTDDWFELRDTGFLTSDHQFDLDDLRESLRDAKRARLAAQPPANPAVMADPNEERPVDLTQRELIPVYELVMSWAVSDSSRGMPVKFPLPAATWNTLRAELGPFFRLLNGTAPKEETTESGPSTSSTSSPEPVPALLPERVPAP